MKEKIKQLLAKSVFIKSESARKILAKLDVLSDEQLQALILLLEEADELQIKLISKVLEVHPDFLDYLENYSSREINKIREEAESKAKGEDRKKMAILEEEVVKL
ncbi:hypothetical protein HON22_02195 [Candidatus Peregrinibacteria bacterium]|jgi:hypothetical protein|nr:hypothetical protein [Candidatus Peregrinibacteria bacterium]